MSTCHICYDEGDIISPCNCKGSIGYVHKTCLEQWIQTSHSNKCPICKIEYAKKTIYSGIFFPGLTALILDYNKKFVDYCKMPLFIVGICVYSIYLLCYLIYPLFINIDMITLFVYINTINICSLLATFPNIAQYIYKDYTSHKYSLLLYSFFNTINVLFTYYHYNDDSYYALNFLFAYTLSELFNLSARFLDYYQRKNTIIQYVNN